MRGSGGDLGGEMVGRMEGGREHGGAGSEGKPAVGGKNSRLLGSSSVGARAEQAEKPCLE